MNHKQQNQKKEIHPGRLYDERPDRQPDRRPDKQCDEQPDRQCDAQPDRRPELEQARAQYRQVTPPEEGIGVMKEAMARARSEKAGKAAGGWNWRQFGAVAAAALTILVVTPNVSPAAAAAMERIPVIGGLIKVVTIRDYQLDDGVHQARAVIPEASAEGEDPEAIAELNKTTQDYIDTLVHQFQTDIAQSPEGYQGLDIDYQVITDNDHWFTLKLSVLETQASGYQQETYYHINKATGQMAHLKDLFEAGTDYRTTITEIIKQQMKDQMAQDSSKVFWLDDPEAGEANFQEIKEDQNFYLDENGNLVIIFNEYEVAPGYMGVQAFTIPLPLVP